MMKPFRSVKLLLAASLIVSIGVCQVQGRKFFLSRIYQGVPTKDLSPHPGSHFSLQKAQPVVKKADVFVEKPTLEQFSLPVPDSSVSPQLVRSPLFLAPMPSLPLLLASERPADRSPPSHA